MRAAELAVMDMTPLRKLRLERGITLAQVATAIGTDTGNVSRMESGEQKSVRLAAKIADFFGRDAITEIEILYPERPTARRRKVAAA